MTRWFEVYLRGGMLEVQGDAAAVTWLGALVISSGDRTVAHFCRKAWVAYCEADARQQPQEPKDGKEPSAPRPVPPDRLIRKSRPTIP